METHIKKSGASKDLVVSLARVKNCESEDPLSKSQKVLYVQQEVECPGCSLHLRNENECAQHILQECLVPRNRIDDEKFRSKLSKWLVKYFRDHYVKKSANEKQNPVNKNKSICKRLEKNHRPFKIQLPVIPFDVRCPVCEKYFWPSEKCYDHLFEKCLYTKSSKNGFSISIWFSQYLWSNSESKLDLISNEGQFQKLGSRVMCKYCRKEFSDIDSMMNHVRSNHRLNQDAGGSVCYFCNFKPGSHSLLFKHIMDKHARCGCGERFKGFSMLKVHLALCLKRNNCLCPLCNEVEMGSLATQADFEKHIMSCRRAVPPNWLNLHDLYVQCDICWKQILRCNWDFHVAKHIKFMDCDKRRGRNSFVNLDDLKDVWSDQDFFKLKTLFPKFESPN